jgi:hypothetical protein
MPPICFCEGKPWGGAWFPLVRRVPRIVLGHLLSLHPHSRMHKSPTSLPYPHGRISYLRSVTPPRYCEKSTGGREQPLTATPLYMAGMTSVTAALFFEASQLRLVVEELAVPDEIRLVLFCVVADITETAAVLLDIALCLEREGLPTELLAVGVMPVK